MDGLSYGMEKLCHGRKRAAGDWTGSEQIRGGKAEKGQAGIGTEMARRADGARRWDKQRHSYESDSPAMACRGWQSSAEDVVCADMVRLARGKRSGDLMSNEEGR